ncbi:DUF3305 domain-containing protein [Starkeya sp. ORNL1]|uniref:DUF3305 domain-containing protein n=1 Tax=Starkeya sp. ORNL1 TaxID=2709380 RepID=UPI0014645227|nr:DUF3305 domain-containing protein [Starkeya sp. ORNL1]QJP16846.1 DUF3305 domain-containing protein [Starkeya sp. ORNL1]
MRSTALLVIPVGVVVERRAARSKWADYLWRPVSVLIGTPAAMPGTPIETTTGATLFYAGETAIELHRTETVYYRDNINSDAPMLWVVLQPVLSEFPYRVLSVTADPGEGEAFTDGGDNIVEALPMPADVLETVRQFIAEYHVERPFKKRRRTPSDALGPETDVGK